jgi:hypothetical protein
MTEDKDPETADSAAPDEGATDDAPVRNPAQLCTHTLLEHIPISSLSRGFAIPVIQFARSRLSGSRTNPNAPDDRQVDLPTPESAMCKSAYGVPYTTPSVVYCRRCPSRRRSA